MRKIAYLFMAVCMMAVVAACSSSTATPGSAAVKYAECLQKGDYEAFVDGIAYDEKMSADDVKQAKAMFLSLLQDKYAKNVEKEGNIKSIEMVSETVAEDGKTAVVELKMVTEEGKEKTEKVKMRLVDGKWLMDIGK